VVSAAGGPPVKVDLVLTSVNDLKLRYTANDPWATSFITPTETSEVFPNGGFVLTEDVEIRLRPFLRHQGGPTFKAVYEVEPPPPTFDLVVGESGEDCDFGDLQTAYAAAPDGAVIGVKSGYYAGLYASNANKSVHFKSMAQPHEEPPTIEIQVVTEYLGSQQIIFEGFAFYPEYSFIPAIEAYAGKIVLINCLMLANNSGRLIEAWSPAEISLLHCTLYDNAETPSAQPLISFSGSNLNITNSIVTGAGNANAIASGYGANVEVKNSFIRGAQFGASGVDPKLTREGFLMADSPARNSALPRLASVDLYNQKRPAKNTPGFDACAEEFTSSNGRVSDRWLLKHGLSLDTVITDEHVLAYKMGTDPTEIYVPPVASITEAAPITWPTDKITLTGTASGGAKNATLSTTWSIVSGPRAATIANASTLSPTITVTWPGDYVLKLSVSDGITTTTAQTTVTVHPPDEFPKVYFKTPTNGSMFPQGSDVTFWIVAEAPTYPIKTVKVYRNNGQDRQLIKTFAGNNGGVPYQFTWKETSEGTVTYTAEAANVFDDSHSSSLAVLFYQQEEGGSSLPWPEPTPIPEELKDLSISASFSKLDNKEPLGLGRILSADGDGEKSADGKTTTIKREIEFYGQDGEEIQMEVTIDSMGWYNMEDKDDYSGSYKWSISSPWGSDAGDGTADEIHNKFNGPKEGEDKEKCPYAGWGSKFEGSYSIQCPYYPIPQPSAAPAGPMGFQAIQPLAAPNLGHRIKATIESIFKGVGHTSPNIGASNPSSLDVEGGITLYERSSIKRASNPVPKPEGCFNTIDDKYRSVIYEVVTLENANYDIKGAPKNMADAQDSSRQDSHQNTSKADMNKDGDFVMIRICRPDIKKSKIPHELVINPPIDRTKEDWRIKKENVRFWDRKGNLIPHDQLKVTEFDNPSGPLATIFNDKTGVELYVEITDLGNLKTSSSTAKSDIEKHRYVDLVLRPIGAEEYTKNDKNETVPALKKPLVRIWRGGYWRCKREDDNTGTLTFYDGKGLYKDWLNNAWKVDKGKPVDGMSFTIVTGQLDPLITDEKKVEGKGPCPRGWYALYERTDFTTEWKGDTPPQDNYDVAKDNKTKLKDTIDGKDKFYWGMGSYCHWNTLGNRTSTVTESDGTKKYVNYYTNYYTPHDILPQKSINFKVELVPIIEEDLKTAFNAHGRGGLQIHPNAGGGGTYGCLGVYRNPGVENGFNACCEVYFLLRHYYGTAILVTKEP